MADIKSVTIIKTVGEGWEHEVVEINELVNADLAGFGVIFSYPAFKFVGDELIPWHRIYKVEYKAEVPRDSSKNQG